MVCPAVRKNIFISNTNYLSTASESHVMKTELSKAELFPSLYKKISEHQISANGDILIISVSDVDENHTNML